MGRTTLAAFCMVLTCAISMKADACTVFGFGANDSRFMGKSYDWSEDHGMLVINKRHTEKRALIVGGGAEAHVWTSRYASLTFNQHGRDFPVGGINEAGLAVEIMLGTFGGSTDGNLAAVNEVQWIQHALDMYGSVEDLLNGADTLRIKKLVVDAHFLVCDVYGECASVEYLGGQLVMHSGEDMPAKSFANSTYSSSKSHLADHVGFGGSQSIPQDGGSLSRFVRAASLVQTLERRETVDSPIAEGFSIADNVAGSGVWRIVYDLEERRVTFRLGANGSLRSVDLDDFALDCTEPTMVYDIDTAESGDVSASFQPYTRAFNGRIIGRSSMVPWYLRDTATRYPENNTRCTL